MTFEQYIHRVFEVIREHPEYRAGQAYFNVLYNERPDLSEQIRGTNLDPFYRDKIIPAFLTWTCKMFTARAV